ncbi:MAG: toll/interleukin-1 receptor domain-containing protein [Ignavibacteriae bacterium]|nr:toll/interleukin-1 receptor domain-containing protein [Ignavibacteriota bacterium]
MASKDLNRNIDEPNEKSSTIQNPVETGISLRDNVVPQAIELFFAYSRSDEKLRDKLETHLSLLKRQGLISTWYDRKIGPGREWESEGVSQHITSAQIILLLISADFIASDYCYGVEMTRAMERHEAREARVIPVILRPCDWSRAPFAKLQALPKDAVPVTKWKNRDEGFQDIAQGLRKAVEELTATLQAALALVLRTRPKTSASVQLQISQEELRGVESKPEKIGLERQYISELRKLPRGGGNSAREYQELVRLIFARVFDRSLSGIQLEETMYDGRKRIDIVATNSAAAGFFEGLSSKSHINCKFIPIECKNYSHSVSNPEFDQIGGRLYKKFGMFGFLVYRSAPDKKTVLKRCQDHLDKDEYILALDDDDLIALLGMRQGEKFDHIEDYLDNKFRALVTKKGKE